MPKFFGIGSSSSQKWDALASDNRDATVKVHESVNSSALGLPHDYGHQEVSVPSEVFQHLAAARRANRVAKNVLHSGAGNQVSDIRGSEGESWAREAITRRGGLDQLKRAQVSQGGNCPVHAAVAAAVLETESLSTPVMRRRQSIPGTLGHEYLIIGDPRVRQWGDRHSVVVDPWPGHPSACTLDQAVLHDSKTGQSQSLTQLASETRSEIWQERGLSDKERGRLENIKPKKLSDINKELKRMHKPPVGEELAEQVLSEEGADMYDVRVATDPSTVYVNEETGERDTFDDIPEHVIDRQRAGR